MTVVAVQAVFTEYNRLALIVNAVNANIPRPVASAVRQANELPLRRDTDDDDA